MATDQGEYRYSLSVTSQFYYCGLPLRLDSYSRCTFNCLYCFANARGGNRGLRDLRRANIKDLVYRLETKEERTVLDELLQKRQPIHFGGMSDPFLPNESELGVSLDILQILADHQYPTIISTKSTMFMEDKYLEILKKGRFLIQVSVSSADDGLLNKIDLGTPGPTKIFAAVKMLTLEGVPAACRIQPLLPTRERDAFEVIEASKEAGISHVAVEHLKVPIEKTWFGNDRLSEILGIDIELYYKDRSSKLIGREWVLPVEDRLTGILELREYTHSKNMSFGAADNDLLLLSDGECCCSGADQFQGFKSHFRFNYAEAARKGLRDKQFSFAILDNIWHPKKSISQYMNSNSRLVDEQGKGRNIGDYILKNWNGSKTGNSPVGIYGVIESGEKDANGLNIYTYTEEMLSILKTNS